MFTALPSRLSGDDVRMITGTPRWRLPRRWPRQLNPGGWWSQMRAATLLRPVTLGDRIEAGRRGAIEGEHERRRSTLPGLGAALVAAVVVGALQVRDRASLTWDEAARVSQGM